MDAGVGAGVVCGWERVCVCECAAGWVSAGAGDAWVVVGVGASVAVWVVCGRVWVWVRDVCGGVWICG